MIDMTAINKARKAARRLTPHQQRAYLFAAMECTAKGAARRMGISRESVDRAMHRGSESTGVERRHLMIGVVMNAMEAQR